MIRRVVAVLLAAGTVLLGGTAYAGSQLVVSSDGQAWSTALAAPLFDPAVRWVPGDTRTAAFYVGNRSGDPGQVSLSAHADDAGGLLRRDDVVLAVRRGHGDWVPLPADGEQHRVLGDDLAPGADQRVQVRATFLPRSANASQLRRLPLSFDVVLSQSTAVVDPPVLPSTGGPELWVLVAGIILVVLGTTVLRTAMADPSQKKDDHDHAH